MQQLHVTHPKKSRIKEMFYHIITFFNAVFNGGGMLIFNNNHFSQSKLTKNVWKSIHTQTIYLYVCT